MESTSLVQILHSRKFWALVLALLAIVAGYATGQIDAWQAIQGAVAALAAYSTGVAIEDAGFKAGPGKPSVETQPEQNSGARNLASLLLETRPLAETQYLASLQEPSKESSNQEG